MKNRIAILGSTGSIGKTVLDLIDKNNFKIILLSANKNYQKLLKQAKIFNVKNLVICDQESYKQSLIYNKDKTIKIKNNFEQLNKIINKKLDYVMSSISGIDGLSPTFKIIKYTKKIAIANKESLICAWPIIKKELNKNKTDFIPVDSEHFSIWSEINNTDIKNIKKIYLTASGGPLLNYNFNKKKKIPRSLIFNHPTWKMGKKITVDSATMMNKCFEVMEAKNIFDLEYDKIDILTHPDSYVHSIIVYNNGISKLVTHDTTMKIPIFNSIWGQNKPYKSKQINFDVINNLNFKTIDCKKFPLINIIKNLPQKNSLYETALITINDYFVDKFLNKKIDYLSLVNSVYEYSNLRMFTKFKKFPVNTVSDVYKTKRFVNFQLSKLGV
jgi:1-deoxy-D-xylulose-5-phosphate reductoisomerase